jgi:AAA domain
MCARMRGLTLIGLGAPEGVAAVADALVAAVPRAETTGLGAFDVEATPLVASRHTGQPVDPEGIAAAARAAETVFVTLWGGVLAPLTPRFSVRDLARELDLPVLLVLPPVARLAGYGLTALDAVRAGGLTPAGVVVPFWPDPPSRVLRDERALLAELSGRPVEVLGAAGAEGWPLDAWLGATGDAGAPAVATPAPAVHVSLEPYKAWEGTVPGDPRVTPRPLVMKTLFEIVAAEGPMTAARAYALYARADGRKLTSVVRAPLSSSMYWLAKESKVLLTRAEEIPWQGEDLVRLPDTPAIRPRELGSRTLEDVPVDEAADLARRLGGVTPGADRLPLKRAILARYGLIRLTTRADAHLDRVLDHAAA